MTDSELRDAAIAELEKTTVGWNKVAGYPPDKLATTHWGKAMGLLDQIGQVTPPPPTPRPATGNILMDGRYETLWPLKTGWSGSQAGTWDYLQKQGGSTITLFDDPAGLSARLTVGADTNSVECIKELTSVPPAQPPDSSLWLGARDFYGMRYRFSADRPPSTWGGAMIAQLHYPVLRYHSWGLVEQSNYVRLAFNTGEILPSGTPGTSFEFRRDFSAIPSSRFSTGQWHYLICEILWATKFTGVTRIWHRKQGESSWMKTIDLVDIPTEQWGYGILTTNQLWRCMTVDGLFCDRSGPFRPLDKWGLYSFQSVPRTLENGGFVRCDSFAAAEAALNPR